jgi:hypothetical protein
MHKLYGVHALSINDLLELRFSVGPGMKYSLQAVTHQNYLKKVTIIGPVPFFVTLQKKYVDARFPPFLYQPSTYQFGALPDVAPALSVDEPVASLARSPMDMGRSLNDERVW